MKNVNWSTVAAVTLLLLAVFLAAAILSGGWRGMMGPVPIAPMGGTMNVGLGGVIILLLGTISFVLLAAWVLKSGGRQK